MTTAGDALEGLQERLGYRFQNVSLLGQALTHRSLRRDREAGMAAFDDNERMEFLGDAVLGLRASERLLELFPRQSEGQLSRMRAWLVSSAHLAEVGERLHIGACLRLSRNEEALGGRGKQRLLANAFEAVVAAVYSDGGYAAAGELIDRHLIEAALPQLSPDHLHEFAYKSALQEWAHANGHPLPVYRVIEATGPEHGKLFTIAVEIEGLVRTQAAAHSKKAAEQQAAREALQRLGVKE